MSFRRGIMVHGCHLCGRRFNPPLSTTDEVLFHHLRHECISLARQNENQSPSNTNPNPVRTTEMEGPMHPVARVPSMVLPNTEAERRMPGNPQASPAYAYGGLHGQAAPARQNENRPANNTHTMANNLNHVYGNSVLGGQRPNQPSQTHIPDAQPPSATQSRFGQNLTNQQNAAIASTMYHRRPYTPGFNRSIANRAIAEARAYNQRAEELEAEARPQSDRTGIEEGLEQLGIVRVQGVAPAAATAAANGGSEGTTDQGEVQAPRNSELAGMAGRAPQAQVQADTDATERRAREQLETRADLDSDAARRVAREQTQAEAASGIESRENDVERAEERIRSIEEELNAIRRGMYGPGRGRGRGPSQGELQRQSATDEVTEQTCQDFARRQLNADSDANTESAVAEEAPTSGQTQAQGAADGAQEAREARQIHPLEAVRTALMEIMEATEPDIETPESSPIESPSADQAQYARDTIVGEVQALQSSNQPTAQAQAQTEPEISTPESSPADSPPGPEEYYLPNFSDHLGYVDQFSTSVGYLGPVEDLAQGIPQDDLEVYFLQFMHRWRENRVNPNGLGAPINTYQMMVTYRSMSDEQQALAQFHLGVAIGEYEGIVKQREAAAAAQAAASEQAARLADGASLQASREVTEECHMRGGEQVPERVPRSRPRGRRSRATMDAAEESRTILRLFMRPSRDRDGRQANAGPLRGPLPPPDRVERPIRQRDRLSGSRNATAALLPRFNPDGSQQAHHAESADLPPPYPGGSQQAHYAEPAPLPPHYPGGSQQTRVIPGYRPATIETSRRPRGRNSAQMGQENLVRGLGADQESGPSEGRPVNEHYGSDAFEDPYAFDNGGPALAGTVETPAERTRRRAIRLYERLSRSMHRRERGTISENEERAARHARRLARRRGVRMPRRDDSALPDPPPSPPDRSSSPDPTPMEEDVYRPQMPRLSRENVMQLEGSTLVGSPTSSSSSDGTLEASPPPIGPGELIAVDNGGDGDLEMFGADHNGEADDENSLERSYERSMQLD